MAACFQVKLQKQGERERDKQTDRQRPGPNLALAQLRTPPQGGPCPGESSCDPCHKEKVGIHWREMSSSFQNAPPPPPQSWMNREVPLNYVFTERAPSSHLPGTGGPYFSTKPCHRCFSWKGPPQLKQRGLQTAQQPKTQISVIFYGVAAGTLSLPGCGLLPSWQAWPALHQAPPVQPGHKPSLYPEPRLQNPSSTKGQGIPGGPFS